MPGQCRSTSAPTSQNHAPSLSAGVGVHQRVPRPKPARRRRELAEGDARGELHADPGGAVRSRDVETSCPSPVRPRSSSAARIATTVVMPVTVSPITPARVVGAPPGEVERSATPPRAETIWDTELPAHQRRVCPTGTDLRDGHRQRHRWEVLPRDRQPGARGGTTVCCGSPPTSGSRVGRGAATSSDAGARDRIARRDAAGRAPCGEAGPEWAKGVPVLGAPFVVPGCRQDLGPTTTRWRRRESTAPPTSPASTSAISAGPRVAKVAARPRTPAFATTTSRRPNSATVAPTASSIMSASGGRARPATGPGDQDDLVGQGGARPEAAGGRIRRNTPTRWVCAVSECVIANAWPPGE